VSSPGTGPACTIRRCPPGSRSITWRTARRLGGASGSGVCALGETPRQPLCQPQRGAGGGISWQHVGRSQIYGLGVFVRMALENRWADRSRLAGRNGYCEVSEPS
jgi:hypothetical protein